MSHSNTLKLESSALVVIDMQEAFRGRIADFSEIASRIAMMVQAANLLKLPICITEQYPKGLGRTASEIKKVLPPDVEILEKMTFSSCGISTFREELRRTGRKQILVGGIEAHVCVNQTVHDLIAEGYQVHLLMDCVSSRHPRNKEAGMAKIQMAGAIPGSVELALFELLRDAGHEHFKAIQKLVK